MLWVLPKPEYGEFHTLDKVDTEFQIYLGKSGVILHLHHLHNYHYGNYVVHGSCNNSIAKECTSDLRMVLITYL